MGGVAAGFETELLPVFELRTAGRAVSSRLMKWREAYHVGVRAARGKGGAIVPLRKFKDARRLGVEAYTSRKSKAH